MVRESTTGLAPNLFEREAMKRVINAQEFKTGDQVVWCSTTGSVSGIPRGSVGTIIGCRRQGPKGKKKLKSVLVKWTMHHKGVVCIVLRGSPKASESRASRDEETGMTFHRQPIVDDQFFLHKASYCHDCPLRLSRLVTHCPAWTTKGNEQDMAYAKELMSQEGAV